MYIDCDEARNVSMHIESIAAITVAFGAGFPNEQPEKIALSKATPARKMSGSCLVLETHAIAARVVRDQCLVAGWLKDSTE